MNKLIAAFGITLLVLPAAAFAAFDVNLKQGDKGTAVVELQNFLIANNYLAAGNSTGYFGALTFAGVKAFQAAKGIQPVSGFFGPLTRAVAKGIGTGCDGCMPSPMDTTTQISLLLQQLQALQAQIAQLKAGSISTVSSTFSVTPTSGTAPLTVTANFEKNSSCGAYSVTWGDGTSSISDAVPPDTACLAAFFPVSLTHTYSTPGTYTVTFDTPSTEPVGRTVTVAAAATNPSFSASPISGAAPLTVWFNTSLRSSSADKNLYSIDFGDGRGISTLSIISACIAVAGVVCDPVLGGYHQYSANGTYTARLLKSGPSHICQASTDVACGDPIASATITVTGTTTSSPLIYTDKTSYNAGETIKVTWNNPATPGTKDWIGMVKSGQNWFSTPNVGEGKSYAWIAGVSGGYTNLVAPAASGNYQIVYFNNTADGAVNSSTEMSRTSAFINYGTLIEVN